MYKKFRIINACILLAVTHKICSGTLTEDINFDFIPSNNVCSSKQTIQTIRSVNITL